METRPFEDVVPIENGDNPLLYVSLPEGIFFVWRSLLELCEMTPWAYDLRSNFWSTKCFWTSYFQPCVLSKMLPTCCCVFLNSLVNSKFLQEKFVVSFFQMFIYDMSWNMVHPLRPSCSALSLWNSYVPILLEWSSDRLGYLVQAKMVLPSPEELVFDKDVRTCT